MNIERGAFFGGVGHLSIGNNSGLGINCIVPSDITIGDNVMMAPNWVFTSERYVKKELQL